MSKLLDIEKRISENRRPGRLELPVGTDRLDWLRERNNLPVNSIRPILSVRYLPIIGEVVREESGIGLPLLHVEFEGVYNGNRRLETHVSIFERRTDGKGRFILLAEYDPKNEELIKDAEVEVVIAGQDFPFRLQIHDYLQHGKEELEQMLGPREFREAFHQMRINESQVVGRQQLSHISIGIINIQ